MAGPSGAGAVAHYLKTTRNTRNSASREVRAALRREIAKAGGYGYEVVGFECFSLCMSCGYLAEPQRRDPMRSEANFGQPSRCPACRQDGLADLRHTPTVEALGELEQREAGPNVMVRVSQVCGLALGSGLLAGAAAMLLSGDIDVMWGLAPLSLISLPVIAPMLSGNVNPRRAMPRRWRLPPARRLDRIPGARKRVRGIARARGALLTAPLSGRPCLAYEVGVRDDDDGDARLGSWRLLEQDNVEFRVGDHEVGRGQALLRLSRQPWSRGLLMSRDAQTQRFMRMRGFVDSEDVHIYETILAPDSECGWAIARGDAVTQIF